jgi:arylsulfatase A-like enzyme
LIVVDCLRSDRVFGADRACRTPAIDRFVARSIGAPNVLVENSMTSPSFGSIFTGCYSLRHGVTGLLGVRLNPDLATMADIFAANGYHTYAEVTGPLMPQLGLDQGFDEYNYRDQTDYADTPWGEAFLRRVAEKRLAAPWFAVAHFWEVHEPRHIPPAFAAPEFGATSYDRALSGLDAYLGRLIDAAGDDAVVILTGDHGERVTEAVAAGSLLPYFMNKLNIPRCSARKTRASPKT